MTTTVANPATPADKAVTDAGRTAERVLDWTGLDEVSAVNQGDNPDARIMLLKQRQDTEQAKATGFFAKARAWAGVVAEKMGYGSPRTVNQILAAQKFEEEFRALRWAFVDSAESIMGCASAVEMGEMMAQSANEFSEQVKALVARLAAGDAAKGKALTDLLARMTQEADALRAAGGDVAKRAPLVATLEALDAFKFDLAEPVSGAQPDATPTEEDDMSTANAAKTAPVAPVTAPAAPASDETLKAVLASVEQMKADLAKANARAESAEATANALKADLQSEKAKKDDAVFTAKAKALAVGPVDGVAALIKRAYAVSAEEGKQAEETLAGIAALVRKAEQVMGKSFGLHPSESSDGAGADTAKGEISARTAELIKSNPAMSEKAARDVVLKADPALKQRWIAESKN